MPAEITSILLAEEGACPIQTAEELANVLKMIFDYRVLVGLENAPEVQNFSIDGAACASPGAQAAFELLNTDLMDGLALVAVTAAMENFYKLVEDYILD